MDNLLKLIPFLSNYPIWVKGVFVLWVLISAVLFICLVLSHDGKQPERTSVERNQTITKEKQPQNDLPKVKIPNDSPQTNTSTAEKKHEKLPPNYSAISPGNVISTLNNNELTELQKKEFMKKHDGRMVRWGGTMIDIKPGYSERWPHIMVFKLPSDNSDFPNLITASFPSDSTEDLSNLTKGQQFVVQGNLTFLGSVTPSPSIENAKLVSY